MKKIADPTTHSMKLYFAADHAGFDLKAFLLAQLTGHDVKDCGAYTKEDTDDYPDFIIPCAKKVAGEEGAMAIIIGGSGQGEAMAANRTSGVRAAVFYGGSLEVVRLSRTHNDANVLSLGARFLTNEEALEAVKLFLDTPFSHEERHIRRLSKF